MDIKVGDLVTIHKAGETFTGLYVGATTEVTAHAEVILESLKGTK